MWTHFDSIEYKLTFGQQFGRTVLSDSPEVTQMMESLVADNEALKRDVAELQNLLTEAREDVRMLQEEVE